MPNSIQDGCVIRDLHNLNCLFIPRLNNLFNICVLNNVYVGPIL